ncbi:DNase/tRNase domain of colicin-like bacteriocin [Paenibacillus sp. yr247]|uniref:HNH endonuclease n=1 Tax=Paenibacillus sp. yr247 TaxID=1761880 RepID=UPI00088FA8C5|nr:HNH endonuclease [Paenibacillus sp. yr247]SDO87762.1 DNase/tRNase domain of colicin-like bacteriocin [Paenibacillus sp. yr247]
MKFLKGTGKMAGAVTGKVIGGSVRVVGELVGSKYVKEIGDSVEKATAKTGRVLGEAASGVCDVGVGLIRGDRHQIDEGLQNAGGAVTTTAKGIGQGIVYVAKNGVEVVSGFKDGETERVKDALKNLGKAAAVSLLAVSVLDVVGGVDGVADASDADVNVPDADHGDGFGHDAAGSIDLMESDANADVHHISTINEDLAGAEHPDTGVHYEDTTVELPNGKVVEGIFPDFTEAYTGELPQDMFTDSDATQFAYMNDQLSAAVQHDPQLASDFTEQQLEQIRAGETPDGYIWHHSEQPGRMELVDEKIHAMSAHTGGRSLWGGGTNHR